MTAPVDTAPAPAAESGSYRLKRAFLGRALSTSRLEQERLGKPTALAVFASDNLSSTAYATEEILRVLVPAIGLAAFHYVFGISVAIVLVEAILVFSYRQTIKAYPTAGGAYIVTRDNFGLLPAQVAGVALLLDYVLTVAVSVSAGVQAITSVVEPLHDYRVPIALGFIWLIAYGNLLGVRESGRLFAVPTYLFVGSLFLTLGAGLIRVMTGAIEPLSYGEAGTPEPVDVGLGAVGLFLVLRAFASGGAAVTGVEAISNGVPAFRKPEWRNARATLVVMAVILGTGFLGISYLASELRVLPSADEATSVLAQIGRAVYGTGPAGQVLFLVLQLSTTLILVLAANTSFADFPRLASFHAGDAFLPRQFTKRGHRLVFSNGVLGLAAAASILVVAFGASVTALIPLYALGVFTSFTLSQAGMARRHLRLREPGWRRGFLINGFGSLVTAVVTLVIAVVKFEQGAWMILVAVPVLVAVLVRVNRTYEAEERELLDGLQQIRKAERQPLVAVVVVDEIDSKTMHAVQYALTVQPRATWPVHVAVDPVRAETLRTEWAARGLPAALTVVPCEDGDRRRCLLAFLRDLANRDEHVTVLVPGPARLPWWRRVRSGHSWSGLVEPLRDLENVTLMVVRDHGGPGHGLNPRGLIQLSPRPRHTVLILVDRLDQAVIKALRYARTIGALDVRALHVAVDRKNGERLLAEWATWIDALGVPLDVEDCPDRNVPRTVLRFVREMESHDTEITVVMPRREYRSVFQRLLHDRTSRGIARALGEEPHVDVVMVPYRLGRVAQGSSVRASRSRALLRAR
jgi:amino acid transporter